MCKITLFGGPMHGFNGIKRNSNTTDISFGIKGEIIIYHIIQNIGICVNIPELSEDVLQQFKNKFEH